MHGLKQGNTVLAEIHKEMNIESVERLMGETQDAIAYQQVCVNVMGSYKLTMAVAPQEINEMLSNVMTADDEDSVQRELAEMQAEAAPLVDEPRIELPAAPDEEPVSQGSLSAIVKRNFTHITH